MSEKIDPYQQKLLDELRSGARVHNDCFTPIYTILLDLCQENGVEEVFTMLHDVAKDLGQRRQLEDKFKEAKKW